eukprot:COSAG02_NODE_4657_length_5125_cov_10.220653_2_plen_317_part_00
MPRPRQTTLVPPSHTNRSGPQRLGEKPRGAWQLQYCPAVLYPMPELKLRCWLGSIGTLADSPSRLICTYLKAAGTRSLVADWSSCRVELWQLRFCEGCCGPLPPAVWELGPAAWLLLSRSGSHSAPIREPARGRFLGARPGSSTCPGCRSRSRCCCARRSARVSLGLSASPESLTRLPPAPPPAWALGVSSSGGAFFKLRPAVAFRPISLDQRELSPEPSPFLVPLVSAPLLCLLAACLLPACLLLVASIVVGAQVVREASLWLSLLPRRPSHRISLSLWRMGIKSALALGQEGTIVGCQAGGGALPAHCALIFTA